MNYHTIALLIEDNVLYNSAAATSITPLHAIPSGGSYVKVTVTGGTNNTGTVAIRGNVSAVDTTDTLTFTAARWYITTHKFDAGNLTSITTTNLANEATKPNVKIETVDVSGTAIPWVTVTNYVGVINDIGGNLFKDVYTVAASGLISKMYKKVRLDGDVSVNLADKFCIVKQPGSYKVISDPVKHFQLGTDYVDYTYFVAEKYQDDEIVEDSGYQIYP